MIRHSLLYFLARVGSGVLTIATLAVFTRLLSPHEYGVYALNIAAASVASAILYQWLNVALNRFYPAHRDNPGVIICVAIRGYWSITAITALLFIAAVPFHRKLGEDPTVLGILFLITIALGRYSMMLQVANAQGLPLRYSLLSWAKNGVSFLAGLALILCGVGERGALIGFLVGLVCAVLVFNPLRGLNAASSGTVALPMMKMLQYGLPLTLTFSALMLVGSADRFMIGWLSGASAVGPYAAAYDLVQQLIGPMMNVMFLAAFPMIVQVLEIEGGESSRLKTRALGRAVVAIGLPAAFGLGILSKDISETFFSSGFRQASSKLIPWLAFAIFVGCFKSYYLDLVFQFRHATKYQGYIAVLMAVVNILLNLLLLPHYGILGAAWSTLAAFSCGALASWLIGRTIFPLPSLRIDFLQCVIASLVMSAILYILPTSHGAIGLATKIICGLASYLLMAWLLDLADCRNICMPIFRRFKCALSF
ncbi:MAG: lipopolysaccharide biosynthesis protein [Acidobacteriaceae bacterium]